MCGPGRSADLLPLEFQPAGLSISTPQHQQQFGSHGKRGEGKLNLVKTHRGAMVIDVSPSFLSHYSSGFIQNKSHSGFRVSREHPSADFTSQGLQKGLTTDNFYCSVVSKSESIKSFSLEGNADQETAQTRNPYEEQLLPSLVMDWVPAQFSNFSFYIL